MFKETTIERFWSLVDKTSTCWIYSGPFDSRHKYYWFSGESKHIRAQRFAWLITYGEITGDDHLVSNACGNNKCVRPEHIELTNNKAIYDKLKDTTHKSKTPKKLTDKQVLEIRAIFEKDPEADRKKVAIKYRITVPYVWQLVYGGARKDV